MINLTLFTRYSQTLNSSGALDALNRSVRNGSTEYDVSVLGIPGLLHFVYKSRPHVQVTHPTWGDDYSDEMARRRYVSVNSIYKNNKPTANVTFCCCNKAL